MTTKHPYHVCPQCGRRIKCDRPRTFGYDSPVSLPGDGEPVSVFRKKPGMFGVGRELKLVLPDVINMLVDPILGAIAISVPSAVITACAAGWAVKVGKLGADWPGLLAGLAFAVTFPASLRLVARFYTYAEPQPEPQPEPDAEEPEDKRAFVGWETKSQTKTTQHLEWYTPPCPVSHAQRYAFALMGNGFDWVDERDLSAHQCVISQTSYRELRHDWLRRGWCTQTGDRKTRVTPAGRHMIERIAKEQPT